MFFNKKDKPYIIPAKFYNDPYYISLFENDKEKWNEEVLKVKNNEQ